MTTPVFVLQARVLNGDRHKSIGMQSYATRTAVADGEYAVSLQTSGFVNIDRGNMILAPQAVTVGEAVTVTRS